MEAFELNAEKRTAKGRAENRRLRRAGQVPAIIYGGNGDPVMLSLEHNDLDHHLDNEAFFSHIIKIHVAGGGTEEAVLRDLQRHPAKPFIEHADFLRIVAGEALRMSVPLHFAGEDECPGVVDEDGVIQHNMNDVEIECLPRNLPEYIEVDCSKLGLNDSIHLSELVLPEGVQIVDLMGDEEDQNDLTVVSVQVPRAAIELEEEDAEAAEAEEGEDADGESDDSEAGDDGEDEGDQDK
ncbi:50S ribosomal protein L25 [Salinisphaera orenii MK-B5]|uniref:Large ribosomal subunit protein bL25 n=2 Tax=Salinisphaera orenii TaxID=856731 RepID=A0A423PQ04_9GAMM|nr:MULTISPECIES: 50S ribosomal protein L25/general stress protein Ctc [Salinisphaera]ROO27706.1 50S ribosomal protein L25 [Salinisphaera orenii MK-B5]ROO36733.1 50S ribosomal protein L25 [Salinisphaera halophila YIM 95161]